MIHAVVQQLLDGIELRERELAEQVAGLAARLREAEAEREAPATTAKTVRAIAADLDLEQPPAPDLRSRRPPPTSNPDSSQQAER